MPLTNSEVAALEARAIERAAAVGGAAPEPLAPTPTALGSGQFAAHAADHLNLRLLAQRDCILEVLKAWGVTQHQMQNGAIQEPPRRLTLRSRSLLSYLSGESDAEPSR